MKINIDFSSKSKSECCSRDQLTMEGSVPGCNSECRSRALLYLSLAGIAFLLVFALGYFMPSSIIRVIWLIVSGTLLVLTGISMIVVFQCTSVAIDDPGCSEESNSKSKVS